VSYNLFVAFDTRDPVREASLVLAAIEELGEAVRLFSTFWYVRSRLTAADAARQLWDIMQPQDTLIVVNASVGEAAAFNVDDTSIEWMQKRWHLRLDEALSHLPAVAVLRDLRTAGRVESSKLNAPRQPRTAPHSAGTP
jgi:hypothetical protein